MVMQMQTKLEGMDLKKAERKLMAYGTLNNPVRLKAFLLIAEQPGVAFNDIVKGLKMRNKPLAAYHLGLLKAGDLVSFTYERKGKKSYSSYNLTELGKETLRELRQAVH
jgi:DNA-binding transcriptional ArsR family regulator